MKKVGVLVMLVTMTSCGIVQNWRISKKTKKIEKKQQQIDRILSKIAKIDPSRAIFDTTINLITKPVIFNDMGFIHRSSWNNGILNDTTFYAETDSILVRVDIDYPDIPDQVRKILPDAFLEKNTNITSYIEVKPQKKEVEVVHEEKIINRVVVRVEKEYVLRMWAKIVMSVMGLMILLLLLILLRSQRK